MNKKYVKALLVSLCSLVIIAAGFFLEPLIRPLLSDKGESKDAYSAPQVRIFDGEVLVMENSVWKSLGSIDALAAADPFLGFSAPAALQESDGVNRDGGKVPVYVPPAAQSAGGGSSGDTGGSTPAAPPSSGEWTPDVL